MSHRVRFIVWIGVVALAVTAPLWIGLGSSTPAFASAAAAQSLVGLGVMLWLLVTTPVGAIMLPGWLSVVLIPMGMLVVSGTAHGGAPQPPGSCWTCVIAIAVALTLIEYPAIIRPNRSARTGQPRMFSSWWLALVLWHPALWLVDPLAISSDDVRRGRAMASFALAALVVLVPARGARRVGLVGWMMSWGGLIAMIVAL